MITSETFIYDNLQRLYSSRASGSDFINYRYDSLGNLLQKTDYTKTQNSLYGASTAGPNAITTLYHRDNYNLTYSYDAVGNRIEDKRNGITKATYEYDAFNLLTYSQHDTGNQILFRYGIDNQRYLKIEQSENAQNSKFIEEVTLYAGPQFEAIRNDRAGVSESKVHVTPYLTVTRKDDQTIRRHFKFQDRLGSTTLITKENGEKVKALSYDAFGKPRDGDDWTALTNPVLDFKDSSLTADITKRGFTEHEHLDNFELIHMNGRMYDFNNGRFLSVDPFIQGTDSQAINPYSYIQNNPLSGVDPTGYCSQEDHLDDCAKDLQAGETEELTDDDGNRIGTVARGDNNEKIITVDGKATVVIENGYEGDRQTVKSVNDGKISDLKSQISEMKPLSNEFVETAEKIEYLENQTKFFERCSNSSGGCTNQLNANYAEQYGELAESFGELVMSSSPGRTSTSTARNSGITKIRGKGLSRPNQSYIELGEFKITEKYYNKLVNNGRKTPGLAARQILKDTRGKGVYDPILGKRGFKNYNNGKWEMTYNPTTGEIFHIQPIY